MDVNVLQDTEQRFHKAAEARPCVKGDRIRRYDPVTKEVLDTEVTMVKKGYAVGRALHQVGKFNIGDNLKVPIEFTPEGAKLGATNFELYAAAEKYVRPEKKATSPAAEGDAADKPKRKPPSRVPEGQKSKLDICKELYAANSGLEKAKIIDLFVDKAGCTKAGATTYYYLCKKKD